MNKRIVQYADLIVRKGLNISKGQEVFIRTAPVQLDFLELIVEKCYQNGASKVIVDMADEKCRKLDFLYQNEETLSCIENWEIEKWKHKSEVLPAALWLDSDDPDGMDGIDQEKRSRAQQAVFPKIKHYRDAMENKHQWCIAGVPCREWALKVFPGLAPKKAEKALWDAILDASRVDGDAIKAWDNHNETMHARARRLNDCHFRELRYKSSNGTYLTVGLIPQGRFCGGSEKDLSGREFNPNIPSEEIFTTPMRGKAEGIVYATKPLSYQGNLIEDFMIRFKDGKAVETRAAKGKDVLDKMIGMDEGACYLGECALIGWDSPINNTGILFYNTLYDENACCHLALGRGFNDCINGFEGMTNEEMKSLGVNDSMIHVDFMIGTDDLEVSGITDDGKEIRIFSKGNWCI